MRVAIFIGLATLATAIPFSYKHEARDLETTVDDALEDVSNVVDGNGNLVTVVNDALNNLGADIGKKRDLITTVNDALEDTGAVLDGNGNVIKLVDDALENLGDTVGITKRTPELLDLNVNVLQGLKGLLEDILSLLGNTVDNLGDDVLTPLLQQLGGILSSVGLNLNLDLNLDDLTASLENLLSQVEAAL